MGSPVSPVVANLCMEEIEEQAMNAAATCPKVWKRYVDDCYSIIKKNAVKSFHETLNSVDPDINFTVEHETNDQLAFLDTLTIRRQGKIHINVYRKPTHTDRYLDFSSHHDKQHKFSTVKTLAVTIPTTSGDKNKELKYVTDALEANGCLRKVISTIQISKTSNPTPIPEELVKMFFNWVDPTDAVQGFATLPYISGITEPLTRTLQNYGILVTNKPVKTLQQDFTSPKYRVPPEEETGVVYRIPCADCSWSYVGETGRSFKTRKKEHLKNVENFAKNSNIATRAWNNSHSIDFNNAEIIDKGHNRIRKTLESCHTAATDQADNNLKPLP